MVSLDYIGSVELCSGYAIGTCLPPKYGADGVGNVGYVTGANPFHTE